MNKITIIQIITIALSLSIGLGAYLITKKNDTPIEQAAEAVLRTHGVDIDFSPNKNDER